MDVSIYTSSNLNCW